jgi:hypothetical protein
VGNGHFVFRLYGPIPSFLLSSHNHPPRRLSCLSHSFRARIGNSFQKHLSLHHVTLTCAVDSQRSHWNTLGAVTTTHVAATHRLNLLLATKHTVLVETFDINTPTERTCSVDVKELGIQDVSDQSDSAAKRSVRRFLLGARSTASQVPTYELSPSTCVSSPGRSRAIPRSSGTAQYAT